MLTRNKKQLFRDEFSQNVKVSIYVTKIYKRSLLVRKRNQIRTLRLGKNEFIKNLN